MTHVKPSEPHAQLRDVLTLVGALFIWFWPCILVLVVELFFSK